MRQTMINLIGVTKVIGMTGVTMLALLCGCTPPSNDGVASAPGGSSGSSGTSATPPGDALRDDLVQYLAAQRAWADCLRGEGLSISGPDEWGSVIIDLGPLGKGDPQVLRAQRKCANEQVPVPVSVERARQPPLSPEQIQQARDHAKCMQTHGAPDFPDPEANGHMPEAPEGVDLWDETKEGAKRAQRECAPTSENGDNPDRGKG